MSVAAAASELGQAHPGAAADVDAEGEVGESCGDGDGDGGTTGAASKDATGVAGVGRSALVRVLA